MGTIIWLTITTLIGAGVGSHWFAAAAIGAAVGFGIGLLLRIMIEAGSGGSVAADGISDIFDILD